MRSTEKSSDPSEGIKDFKDYMIRRFMVYVQECIYYL